MTQAAERGRAGERRAERYLRASGYRIAARNWRCPDGEVDIIALTRRAVVVVEVKTRASAAYGDPCAAVDAARCERLRALGRRWCRTHAVRAARRRVRVDVIGILGPDVATARLEHREDVG